MSPRPLVPLCDLLHPHLCTALARTRPAIFHSQSREPPAPAPARATRVQEVILDHFRRRLDLLTAAPAGTGKSLALVLGWLARTRTTRSERVAASSGHTLLLVPYYPLASQLFAWTAALLDELRRLDGTLAGRVGLYGDVGLVQEWSQDEGEGEGEGGSTERLTIATPLGYLAQKTPTRASPDLVILDEVDALLRLPGRYAIPSLDLVSQKGRGRSAAARRWATHPPPGYLVLSEIMGGGGGGGGDEPGGEQSESQERGSEERMRLKTDGLTPHSIRSSLRSPPAKPQVIATSATVNSVLRSFLMHRTGWLDKQAYVAAISDAPASLGQVQHTAVVVQDGTVRNLRPRRELEQVAGSVGGKSRAVNGDSLDLGLDDLLSALATSIRLERQDQGTDMGDVLVFTHAAVSSQSIEARLARAGVESEPLQEDRYAFAALPAGRRRVYLAKEHQARGLDLATLSHVYILSLATATAPCPSNDTAYQHMAGRLGRLGSLSQVSGGKVIQLLALPSSSAAAAAAAAAATELDLHQSWERLNLLPVPYPHLMS